MNLSETIRAAMKRDGRSWYALSNDSGVSRGQLVRFFNGQRELTLPAASKLCAALGLELRRVRRQKVKGG
jgi:transcriptional regulator with XRE-family HTH domain